MSNDRTNDVPNTRRTTPEAPGLAERLVGAARHAVGDLLNSVDADAIYLEGDDIVDTKAPKVPIDQRWDERRFNAKLVNPANRRKLSVIIVGTGLAGGAAAATLGEAGYGHKLLLPGLPAAGPLHRRAGRHQRGEELPQRRRLGLPAVLRHGEGR